MALFGKRPIAAVMGQNASLFSHQIAQFILRVVSAEEKLNSDTFWYSSCSAALSKYGSLQLFMHLNFE